MPGFAFVLVGGYGSVAILKGANRRAGCRRRCLLSMAAEIGVAGDGFSSVGRMKAIEEKAEGNWAGRVGEGDRLNEVWSFEALLLLGQRG